MGLKLRTRAECGSRAYLGLSMSPRSILVTGASIAGPALAFWLHRHGHQVVVMERAPALRTGGQTVDIRGAAREVARRMGIEDEIRAHLTHEDGIRFVDEENRTQAEFGAGMFGGEGFVSELEILRGELARILVERTRDDVEYVYGNQITRLVDEGPQVDVGFEQGSNRKFDLVIAAEGFRSRTRQLLLGDEASIRWFNLHTAYFTIPRAPSDTSWMRWYNAPGNLNVTLRPDNLGTTRALMSFQGKPRGYERLEPAQQKALLRQVFARVGWEAPRVLAALEETPDFYFESIGQIRLPRWSRGRVALTGDAAYCASPISGMGTALALVGAYVLAGELRRHDDHREAFTAYEKLMRPYVKQAQGVPSFAPRLASPRTRAGIRFGHAVLRAATRPIVKRVIGRFISPPADAIELPDYGLIGTDASASPARLNR